jgi:hypothetical protein
MRCRYYLPWVETSRGEIDDACVNNEKRTIKQCPFFNRPEECPEFEQTGGAVSKGSRMSPETTPPKQETTKVKP